MIADHLSGSDQHRTSTPGEAGAATLGQSSWRDEALLTIGAAVNSARQRVKGSPALGLAAADCTVAGERAGQVFCDPAGRCATTQG